MVPLPVLPGQEARRAFERLGWQYQRMHGSHMILSKPGSKSVLSIPDHRPLGRGIFWERWHPAGILYSNASPN